MNRISFSCWIVGPANKKVVVAAFALTVTGYAYISVEDCPVDLLNNLANGVHIRDVELDGWECLASLKMVALADVQHKLREAIVLLPLLDQVLGTPLFQEAV